MKGIALAIVSSLALLWAGILLERSVAQASIGLGITSTILVAFGSITSGILAGLVDSD